eukprot:m.30858 g.30858  ORF g.30858 m.30858 type:complete len:91 (-) comp6847_c0_seq1:110-382(-)
MADVKPDIKPDSGQIELSVKSEDNVIKFKVKQTTKIAKIKDAYCKKMGLTPANVRFLFDGDNIPDTATPSSVGLEDGDIIDVARVQLGGQ